MSDGVKVDAPVKNLQSPAEYPVGLEYVPPHLA